jgi:DNA-binding transcriptional regulator GbsR (MarR family)
MIDSWNPTPQAPDENSPSWYKNYHALFNTSQIVDNVLFSYMRLFIKECHMGDIIIRRKAELIEKGIISGTDPSGEKLLSMDFERMYATSIEESVENIINSFSRAHIDDLERLNFAFVNTNYFDGKEVKFDVQAILELTGTNDWYKIVTGFLNLWQFLFLFSITESILKEITKNNNIRHDCRSGLCTTELVEKINRKFQNLNNLLEDKHGISKELSEDIWRIFTKVRNIYSHTHGVISEKDKRDIKEKAESLRESYSNSIYPEQDRTTTLINSIIMTDPDGFFCQDRLEVGKFFFLGYHEINLFRNFISSYVYCLSKSSSA